MLSTDSGDVVSQIGHTQMPLARDALRLPTLRGDLCRRSTTCQWRSHIPFKVLIAVVAGLLATASVAEADHIAGLLTGYEESPSVSTTGRGEFIAKIASDGDVYPL